MATLSYMLVAVLILSVGPSLGVEEDPHEQERELEEARSNFVDAPDDNISYSDLMLFGSDKRRPTCRQRKRCTKKGGTCQRKDKCVGKSTRGCPGRKCTCCLTFVPDTFPCFPKTTTFGSEDHGICARSQPPGWEDRGSSFCELGCTGYSPPEPCNKQNCNYNGIDGVCAPSSNPPGRGWIHRGPCKSRCECYTPSVGGLGGWSSEKPATAEIQKLLVQLKPVVEKRIGKIGSYNVMSYRYQVVAGMNYFAWIEISAPFDITAIRFIHILAFQPLPGNGPLTLKYVWE